MALLDFFTKNKAWLAPVLSIASSALKLPEKVVNPSDWYADLVQRDLGWIANLTGSLVIGVALHWVLLVVVQWIRRSPWVERRLLSTPFATREWARRDQLRTLIEQTSGKAGQHACSILSGFFFDVLNDSARAGSINELTWLRGLVHGATIDEYNRSYSIFSNGLRHPSLGGVDLVTEAELAERMGEYWRRYSALIGAVVAATRISPNLVKGHVHYLDLVDRDQQFVIALRQIFLQPNFGNYSSAVEQTGWGNPRRLAA